MDYQPPSDRLDDGRSDHSADEYTRKLRELIDGRMSSGRDLATAATRTREARAALDAAEREYADAFATALRAGWTEAELGRVFKDVNVPTPTKPRRSRPRQDSRGRADTSAAAPSPDDQHEGSADNDAAHNEHTSKADELAA